MSKFRQKRASKVFRLRSNPNRKKPAAQAVDADAEADSTNAMGNIRTFSKMAVTFKPLMGL